MQKSVYKYPLDLSNSQVVMMPVGSKILDIQMQDNGACIWALVNTESELIVIGRTFETYGTGQAIYFDQDEKRKYIGTYQKYGGAMVFHVFELLGA